ncbi:MAG TPA: class I SAM-dependent methyltransferase [Acidobacteriota bacterium]|nr:class I SAM-dependent methyltransferase [Acidobacteriota bacterium]
MPDLTEKELAAYFGLSTDLLPYLDELLIDFDELGSDSGLVTGWLREHGIGVNSRVIDLACGKGAVAVALARALGCSITGIDAFVPFVKEGQARAEAGGVAGLCRFRAGDIRIEAGMETGYDAALMLAVGAVFGGPRETIGILRHCVKPGGLIVIDDAYLLGQTIDFPGYDGLRSGEQTRAQLTSYGDEVLAERLGTRAEAEIQNRLFQTRIEERGRSLATRRPELASDIAAYIEKERRECEIIERDIQNIVWLLRRTR